MLGFLRDVETGQGQLCIEAYLHLTLVCQAQHAFKPINDKPEHTGPYVQFWNKIIVQGYAICYTGWQTCVSTVDQWQKELLVKLTVIVNIYLFYIKERLSALITHILKCIIKIHMKISHFS